MANKKGPHETYQDISRRNWGTNAEIKEDGTMLYPSASISNGCLLRIADATEKMAYNFTFLTNENISLKKKVAELEDERRRMKSKINRLQKQLTPSA